MKSFFNLKDAGLFLGGFFFLAAAFGPALAQDETPIPASPSQPAQPVSEAGQDLTQMSLESLAGLDVQVTSSAKKAESLRDATSAIFVITQDDIKRSGSQHLADLFRMVPGMLVSRVDASQWAITSRGFNSLYNNKMLVLVDGRSVYQSTFGGVNWDELDIPLEDIERIEVIRGPGGTLWGSNAVNGVINIITKDSKVTQGFYATSLTGSDTNSMGALRYGGKIGDDLFYRVYAKTLNQGPFADSDGLADNGQDNWTSQQAGLRMDWHEDKDVFTLQGDYQVGNIYAPGTTFNPLTLQTSPEEVSDTLDRDDHILGNWVHTFSDSSEVELKLYYDQVNMAINQSTVLNTADAEFQHRFQLNDWNEVTWGGDFRNVSDNYNYALSGGTFYTPARASLNTYGAFLQDKLTLWQNQLYLTAGTKLENNPYTGDEWEPSGRLLWTPDKSNSLWAAVSRTVRVPSRSEEGITDFLQGQTAPGPTTFYTAILGNPNLQVEDVVTYELGYRTSPTPQFSIDLAGFYDRYYRMIGEALVENTTPPFPPTPLGGFYGAELTVDNVDGGGVYGAELSVKWDITDSLKSAWAYTYNGYDQTLNSTSNIFNGNPPPHNIVDGRLSWDADPQWQFNTTFYWVDATYINNPTGLNSVVAPYDVWDLGLTWKPAAHWEVSVWGQDLEGTHTEAAAFLNGSNPVPSVYGQVTVRY